MINICYLYYDILNLYGEKGNIFALKKKFEEKVDVVNVDLKSKEDNIDFSKYDVIYMGSGRMKNLDMVYSHMKKYKKELKDFIDKKKLLISTGSSTILFSNEYLKLFDFDIIYRERLCEESTLNINEEVITYFINDNFDFVINNKELIFLENDIKYNNFYAIKSIGPFFARNESILDQIIKPII